MKQLNPLDHFTSLFCVVLGASLAFSGQSIRLGKLSQTQKDQCFHLNDGEAATVVSEKQRYGDGTYLVARTSEAPVAMVGLHATLEALLDGCAPVAGSTASGPSWFVNVGGGDSEMAALASSLGCSVAALEPKPEKVAEMEMTSCVNEPKTPFVVLPNMARASDSDFAMTNPTSTNDTLITKVSSMKSAGGVAAVATKTNVSSARQMARGIILDELFMGSAPPAVANFATKVPASSWSGDIAMLKVTPTNCCGEKATLEALQGAKALLKSTRVRALVAEVNFSPDSSNALMEEFHELEHMGYKLLHIGPLDAPTTTETENGSYPLFATDSHQLQELVQKLLDIRAFDEKTGQRAWVDGVNLDRKGRYFDYTELVIAYQGKIPERLTVIEKSKNRFKNGKWWPEKVGE